MAASWSNKNPIHWSASSLSTKLSISLVDASTNRLDTMINAKMGWQHYYGYKALSAFAMLISINGTGLLNGNIGASIYLPNDKMMQAEGSLDLYFGGNNFLPLLWYIPYFFMMANHVLSYPDASLYLSAAETISHNPQTFTVLNAPPPTLTSMIDKSLPFRCSTLIGLVNSVRLPWNKKLINSWYSTLLTFFIRVMIECWAILSPFIFIQVSIV